jgi:hypothetical protein
MRCSYQGIRTYKNHVNPSVDACISSHIKLEHVITCTFECTNGAMHVESFSDAAQQLSFVAPVILASSTYMNRSAAIVPSVNLIFDTQGSAGL